MNDRFITIDLRDRRVSPTLRLALRNYMAVIAAPPRTTDPIVLATVDEALGPKQ